MWVKDFQLLSGLDLVLQKKAIFYVNTTVLKLPVYHQNKKEKGWWKKIDKEEAGYVTFWCEVEYL